MKKKNIIIIGIIVVAAAITSFFFISNGNKEVIFHTADVKEGNLQLTVTATGYIQPVDKVDVGTQVSGVIQKIYVDFNSHVKKGQLLAEIDKSTLSEKVSQGQASVASAESDLSYSEQNYNRIKQLYDAKAATQADFEAANNKFVQAKSSLVNAKANLHQARVNLAYAEIYSPIEGVVLNRAVEQGQTVAASFNTPTLFTIANDLKKMQVEANVDEADIGSVSVGQKVTFTVDSYTDDVFTGTVKQIRLQPTVTSNVVTYTVIVDAPNPEEKLFPGMTANITIITHEVTGLVIPMEALKFYPSNEVKKHSNIEEELKGETSGKSVWVKTADNISVRPIKVGINDGVLTLVEEGLQKNEKVVLSATYGEKKKKSKEAATNPFVPKFKGGSRSGGMPRN